MHEVAEAADRDSPSPVIIWRHAAPVRLASNVPADLLPRAPPPAHVPRGTSDSARRRSPQRGSQRGTQRGSPPGAAGFGGEVHASPRADRRQLQHDYANSRAWYLPTSSWVTSGEGSKGRGRDGGGSGGEAGEAGESGSMELLPKLYSSRIYKEYLKKENIQRIPHYLAQVEMPKQLPARRGNTSPPRRAAEEGDSS